MPEVVVHTKCTLTELEIQFQETTTIAADGRYVVRIPLRGELDDLGDSHNHGVKRLLALERKLVRNQPTYNAYRAFMREYLEMGHMTPVTKDEWHQVRYVIPHSCVIKPESTTTKLRVVFDASAKTSSGISLNDIQAIGPVIQPDLLRIWLDFRTHTVVATADIAKMYRQVWVSDEDSWMQCILWREHPQEPIQMYRLRTVTYGEAASSYLACRALHEVGEEINSTEPEIASAIQHCFYVDNLALGAATPERLRALCDGVERSLLRRGMPLRKWASNNSEVIRDVPYEHRDVPVDIGDRQAIRMLGLAWSPSDDSFHMAISEELHQPVAALTKRALISRISKLYDPVGILQPIIITAKMMMQDLWREDLAWDDEVPTRVVEEWNEFTSQLPLLRRLTIPRMATPSETSTLTIHGFCDASIKAYGCVIYVTFNDEEGNKDTRLLCSKSRVAPLKTLTLPRLELQAALLLTELYVRIRDVFGSRVTRTCWWSDSQVALTWIRSDNTRWDIFVKNRVSKIQADTNRENWHYVPTKLNPSDIVSRGIPARRLIREEITTFWLNGPAFINDDTLTIFTPKPGSIPGACEVVEPQPQVLIATVGPACDDMISRYKHHCSFSQTRRHFAWIGRAMNNFKIGCKKLRADNPYLTRRSGPLEAEELAYGARLLLRVMQTTVHPNEVREMLDTGLITARNRLQHLNPTCNDGLICVRGRLLNAELPTESRLPILIPKSHPFSRVILLDIHEKKSTQEPIS
uniref:Reverse transcriptase domain-containing protein n=1 Tax=Anopheles atroparvus TaxID=41427 RepID=A0AAG5DSG1_ANOAO